MTQIAHIDIISHGEHSHQHVLDIYQHSLYHTGRRAPMIIMHHLDKLLARQGTVDHHLGIHPSLTIMMHVRHLLQLVLSHVFVPFYIDICYYNGLKLFLNTQ